MATSKKIFLTVLSLSFAVLILLTFFSRKETKRDKETELAMDSPQPPVVATAASYIAAKPGEIKLGSWGPGIQCIFPRRDGYFDYISPRGLKKKKEAVIKKAPEK